MREIIGICGTPGTGKKTVAPLVATLVGLPEAISINSLARKGAVEVDTALLRRKLLRLNPTGSVLFGHLLPHVLRKPEAGLVAVLRCEPLVLKKRLTARGYPAAKVTENVEAELIGVSLDECVKRFGPDIVREYDTTSRGPGLVARAVAEDAKTVRAERGGPAAWIDWTLGYDSSTKLRSLLAGRRAPPAST